METPTPLLIIFVVIPTGFLVLLVLKAARNKRIANHLFGEGIHYVKMLRKLLTYIQRHRGLTTGYINGNTSSQKGITELGSRIQALIIEVPDISRWMRDNSNWNNLVDHWERLSKTYHQDNSVNNFKQHNILIANLLYLIEDVADTHYLTKLGSNSIDADWRHLLSIAEHIGQARALGTGAAAKGECSGTLRIQLHQLHTQIESCIDSTWPHPIKAEINALLACIKMQFINGNPTITADEYFILATRCIDHILMIFDKQIAQLRFFRR
jgi:hypothetical protein